MSRLSVLVLSLFASSAMASPGNGRGHGGTPPGLEQQCERVTPTPTDAEALSDALRVARTTPPCDLVAERGICLFDGARLAASGHASMSLVPFLNDPSDDPSTPIVLFASSNHHFVDDWQGETAYIKVDGHVVWTTSHDQRATGLVASLLPPLSRDESWKLQLLGEDGTQHTQAIDTRTADALRKGTFSVAGQAADLGATFSVLHHSDDGAISVVTTLEVVYE